MTRDETVALLLQGREAWNAWAGEMLAKRKTLEDAHGWKEAYILVPWEPKKGATPQTQAWLDTAFADFSRCLFLARDKQNNGSPSGNPPVKSIEIEGKAIDFSGFVFPGDASFEKATFSGDANFEGATFSGLASFEGATFLGEAVFALASFLGSALFYNATFSGYTWFLATVSRFTLFNSATFSGPAWFGGVFSGPVSFDGAAFRNSAGFQKTKFRAEASFQRIEAAHAFDMTGSKFAQVPSFGKAIFAQAPGIDRVEFPLPRFWRSGSAELSARYHEIRRIAAQSGDFEREHMAFKGELRSRRWTQDRWWHVSLWLGLAYDGISDCGHSIARPANVWLASIAAFAALYWAQAQADIEARCEAAGGAELQALYLSVKNAMVILAGTRDARVNQAYLCLYNGSTEQPHIPPGVAFVETLAQLPLSVALIFLFALAVRNQFKIR
jgi:uncharacterized protein YjbI with pentapeptide repeats